MIPEKLILDFLNENLNVPAYMEKQPDMPESYVMIERTGSDETNQIYSAVFTIQSYAPSLYKAALLNEEAKKVMKGINELPEVAAVYLESDYEWTDTQTKSYRYQALYDLTFFN